MNRCRIIVLVAFGVLYVGVSFAQQAGLSVRDEKLMDFDWRFHRGDVSGAERVGFDDSQWRKVDLPHDWSIEDIPGTDSPYDPLAIGAIETGYSVGGIGWYRKTFTVTS